MASGLQGIAIVPLRKKPAPCGWAGLALRWLVVLCFWDCRPTCTIAQNKGGVNRVAILLACLSACVRVCCGQRKAPACGSEWPGRVGRGEDGVSECQFEPLIL